MSTLSTASAPLRRLLSALALMAVLALACACGSTADDGHGSTDDAHDHSAHYSHPPGLPDAAAPTGVLTGALSTIYSWQPVTDDSPTDALRRATPRLTGQALASATTPPAGALRTPALWSAWRTSGDLITARVETAQAVPTAPNSAFGRATVTQTILHLNGGSTPYRTFTVTAHLTLTDGTWKLSTFPEIANQ